MQNTVIRNENGKDIEVMIYDEYTDYTGFVIREMLETKTEYMRFQVGKHSIDRTNIKKFQIHGFGRTKEEALLNASNKLLRLDIEKHNAGWRVVTSNSEILTKDEPRQTISVKEARLNGYRPLTEGYYPREMGMLDSVMDDMKHGNIDAACVLFPALINPDGTKKGADLIEVWRRAPMAENEM